MVRTGKERHGEVRHGLVGSGVVRHGKVRHGLARFGLEWSGDARHGEVRCGEVMLMLVAKLETVLEHLWKIASIVFSLILITIVAAYFGLGVLVRFAPETPNPVESAVNALTMSSLVASVLTIGLVFLFELSLFQKSEKR